jgi:hypothetical protein
MRRSIATAGAVLLGLFTLTPGVATAAPDPAGGSHSGLNAVEKAALADGVPFAPKAKPGTRPKGANPYLANLADPGKADYSGWKTYLAKQAAAKAAAKLKTKAGARAAALPVLFSEDEFHGTRGGNDNPDFAQRLRGFGTGTGQASAARVIGQLDNEAVTTTAVAPNVEEDGSIPTARVTGIGTIAGVDGVTTTGEIGDGAHGSLGDENGDFDFYAVTAPAGDTITAETSGLTGGLDTLVRLYAADGSQVAIDDDGADEDLASKMRFKVTTAGTYYLAVGAFGNLQASPADPASGDGWTTEGNYHLSITSAQADVDFFAVNLKKGDVLGASVTGSPSYITVYDTLPREVHGSTQDASAIYPSTSPLPAGGNAQTDYVATQAGWHFIGVESGSGAYDITVEAFRPVLQGNTPPVQTLFLDFDGGRVNTAVFGGPGTRTLSPFAAFMSRWNIPRTQEDELIEAITASVTENLKQDMIDSGLNNRFKLQVTNSLDDDDTFGDENVSRIVIGGTQTESGIATIGIAQSIDPGNFDTEESALVLLDTLSAPAGSSPASLNTYLGPASDRIAFVAQAVGNVTSHEAGHFFGNFHTDNASPAVNLQDAGGANFQNLFGVGPDNIGGTADDVDVDFGDDAFSPAEGFVGTEDTLGRIAFGITS